MDRRGLEMKYAFTPDKRKEIIDELESYLTDEFVREVQTRPRAWIYLDESIRVYPSEIIEYERKSLQLADHDKADLDKEDKKD